MTTLQAQEVLEAALQRLLWALFGPGSIESVPEATARVIPSRDNRSASARSMVLGSNLDAAPAEAPYFAEGAAVHYEITNDVVTRSVGGDAHALSRARTHNGSRQGSDVNLVFDLIAASGDRVIAKEKARDRVFVAVVADPYVHFANDHRLRLPQSLFKLDPEIATANPDHAALVRPVDTIANDDELHPATERFPLFRFLFETALQSFVHRVGLFEQMNMRFESEVWFELDTRPLRASANAPSAFPRYHHVSYRSDDPSAPRLRKLSVDYECVLDLGVGVTHLHEQHDNRFGGEIDNLGKVPVAMLQHLAGVTLTPDQAYQIANGPIQDYGGWVDGTCIYFMLVQLKDFADTPDARRNAFAVLWLDEQTGFTERWRVLDLEDNKFVSPFKPIIALVTDSDTQGDFYPGTTFDASRFWSPLEHGSILPSSRMAVSRQIVVLSGQDPVSRADELYTIHFSWPTMDRTWRWRTFPSRGDGASRWKAGAIDAATLRIREDTTIALSGKGTLGEDTRDGWWLQHYLPADGQEQPTLQRLIAERDAPAKPTSGYTHAWRFVCKRVFEESDRRYGHFGVYEHANAARKQAYRVTVHRTSGNVPSITNGVWVDAAEHLKLTHRRVNWHRLVHELSIGGDATSAIEDRDRPWSYDEPLRFSLRPCPGLGDERTHLLTHHDIRNEKLKSFDNVGSGFRMKLYHWTPGHDLNMAEWIEISLDAHLRNDVRGLHGRTVAEEVDALSPPQVSRASVRRRLVDAGAAELSVSLCLARNSGAARHPSYGDYAQWAAVNVRTIRLGTLFDTQMNALDDPVVMEWHQPDWVLEGTGEAVTIHGGFVSPTHPLAAQLAELLTERGAAMFGTSLWFVGATGLVSTADDIEWV